MRRLTESQQSRIDAALEAVGCERPYTNCADLDFICLDGWFHLDHLKALVTILTTCEQELAHDHISSP